MTRTADGWAALQGAIDGRVVLPGSADYESARKPQMVQFHDMRPVAVVLCESPADVSRTIAYARRHRLEMAIRSGGHSVAGRSSTDGLVLDVTPMDAVSVQNELTTVGAGVRLGHLYDVLDGHGRTLPAGGSHSVGIAGLTLGGGIGILGRRFGLTCDHLLRVQIVMADGQVLECDQHENDDLFWALRGAGSGNFGVVTSLMFGTIPAPAATVFHLVWPLDRADQVIQAWQQWAPTAPDGLDATLRLSATGDGEWPPMADLFGVVVGDDADPALLDEILARAGTEPISDTRRHVSYRQVLRYLDGLGPMEELGEEPSPPPPPTERHIFTKSEFFRRLLSRDTTAALAQNLLSGLAPGQSREVAFLPWGGAYNRVDANATAFVHRDEQFIVQHLVSLDATGDTTRIGPAREWLRSSWSIVHPLGSGGVYPNFPDPDLQDWAHAYFGMNYQRLLQVKARYDPDGFFRSQQSLTT